MMSEEVTHWKEGTAEKEYRVETQKNTEQKDQENECSLRLGTRTGGHKAGGSAPLNHFQHLLDHVVINLFSFQQE